MVINKTIPGISEAAQLAAAAFGQQDVEYFMHQVQGLFATCDLVYSGEVDGNLIGFAGFKVFPELNTLYLSCAAVDPNQQRQGFLSRATRLAIAQANQAYLAFRTQSASMWRAGTKLCSSSFPDPDYLTAPQAIILAGMIDIRLGKSPGNNSLQYPGHYGESLYGYRPAISDRKIQDWWDEICDSEQGDAVMFIGLI